jgi:hypothetical protein
MRWIARGARTGPASVTLWVLAWIAFFVPLAVAVSRLARRIPDQGGVYVWVPARVRPAHGFICGWCLWVNNLFYFPSLLLFGAANFAAIGGRAGRRWARRAGTRSSFVLAGIWIAAGINIVGLRWASGCRTPARSASGSRRAADRLRRARARAFGSATPFTRATMVPRGDCSTRRPVVGDVLRVLGFEITSLIGQEVEIPSGRSRAASSSPALVTTSSTSLGSRRCCSRFPCRR